MSASSERRIDGAGLNYTQRVFDALRAHPGSSVEELHAITGMPAETIRSAMKRLRFDRALTAVCVDRVCRYSLASGAIRPVERRGGKRQASQEIAA